MFCWLVSNTWRCSRVLKGRPISQRFRPLVALLWGAREHLKNRMCLLFLDALDFRPPLTTPVASSLSLNQQACSRYTFTEYGCPLHSPLNVTTIAASYCERFSSWECDGWMEIFCGEGWMCDLFLDDTFWMIAATQREQSIKKRRPSFVREGTRSSCWVSLTLINRKE